MVRMLRHISAIMIFFLPQTSQNKEVQTKDAEAKLTLT